MKKSLLLFFSSLLLLALGLTSCENPQPDGGNNNSPSSSTKTGSILGCVTDFATGEPIPNANVQLRPSGETTLTGYNGMFEFLNVPEGNYSITVSKAEYTDLIDDYVISVREGRNMRRDVQLEKIPTYIRFTDMMGNDITDLDFSANTSMDMQSFNIYNHGTVKIACNVVYSCNWIVSVSPSSCEVRPGSSALISVKIDRSKLATGDNTTKLYITSNNGSNVINVIAGSLVGNPPSVNIYPVDMITATSARVTAQVLSANNGIISDCGFYYSTSPSPSRYGTVIKLGAQLGNFTYTLKDLKPGTKYYVCAYAISNLGTAYTTDVMFTTSSGIPTCYITKVSNLSPTGSIGESAAYSNDGCDIIDKGLCWSTYSNPTIINNTVSSGFGDGAISGMLYPLKANTTYYVRSYAQSESGISYGPEMNFTTLSGLATVTTNSARLVGEKIVTGGKVSDNAGCAVYEYGVCYGSSPNPDLSWKFDNTLDGYGTGSFTSEIPLYMIDYSGYVYIRAYATTEYGTSYGEQVKIYIY